MSSPDTGSKQGEADGGYTKAKTAEEKEKTMVTTSKRKGFSLTDTLRPLASLRYLIIRTISVPVPFFSHKIPFIGGRTAIELVIMAAVAALSILAAGTGGQSDVMSGLLVLLAMRWNVLTVVLGIPFERAIFWHKGCALVAMGCIGVHMAYKGNNDSGIALIALMGIACGAYLIKPFFFDAFYFIHIVSYVITVPFAFSHGCDIFPYAIIFWGGDLVLRYIITQHRIEMQAEALAGDVVRLSFPKRFEYEPGQYCFLLIPAINYVEYHPFSISSSFEEASTKIHIRALGDWSKKLLEKTREMQKESNGEPVPLQVFCEGPYGAPSIDHDSKNYKVWLLISGGIGITPLQSMYNHFIHQTESGERGLRKVIFVWSVKDKATAEMMEADRAKASYLPLSFQPSMGKAPRIKSSRIVPVQLSPRGNDNDEAVSVEMADKTDSKGGGSAAGHMVVAASENKLHDNDVEGQRATDAANEDGNDIMTPLIFHAEYYLTQVRSEEQFKAAGIDPVEQKHLHFGRPNIPDLFRRTRELCEKEGIKRVGVMTCGPKGMVDEVMDLCQMSQINPICSTVRFDGHAEVFNF